MAASRWNVRVLDPGAVAGEARWAGCGEADARALAVRAGGQAVVLEQVDGRVGARLQEAIRAAGGDSFFAAAEQPLPRRTDGAMQRRGTHPPGFSPEDESPGLQPGAMARAVLVGTAAVFEALEAALERGPDDLKEVGREIACARRGARRRTFEIVLPGGRRLVLGARPALMSIVNVTPDSFSGDGLAGDPAAAVARALGQIEAGADLVDVGGESTRPGSDPVSVDEELRRVLPVIERLAARVAVPISIDTRRGRVAREALAAGAAIVNDVTGLQGDPEVAAAAADAGAAVVIMHMQGDPKTMQRQPHYDNVMADVCRCLQQGLAAARQAGIPEERTIVDPGVGFGKTLDHNLEILARLGELRSLGRPILVGVSRKRFIGDLTGLERPADRAFGTAAACALAVAAGATLLRVHDVAPMRQAAAVAAAIAAKGGPSP